MTPSKALSGWLARALWQALLAVVCCFPIAGAQTQAEFQTPAAQKSRASALSAYATPPQLKLTVDNATPRANQSVRFTVIPPNIETIAGPILFYWNDGSKPEQVSKGNSADHIFQLPGAYKVYARWERSKLPTNTVDVTVGFAEVTLRPETVTPVAGSEHSFTAQAIPEPLPGSKVEYCFHWADQTDKTDKTEDTCGAQSVVEHIYAGEGKFSATVTATVNKAASLTSAKVDIQVQPVPFKARLSGYSRLGVGQEGSFEVEVTPELAAADKPEYCFRWDAKRDAKSPFDCRDSPKATHIFDEKRSYTVSAEVRVSGRRIPAGSLIVNVFAYGVTLTPQRVETKTGQTVVLHARLSPVPRGNNKVEYCFLWDDGKPDSCQTGDSAVHVYTSSRTYNPRVDVRINGEAAGSSAPATIDVTWAWRGAAILTGMLLGILAAAYGGRKLAKLLHLQITSHPGAVRHEVTEPSSINKEPASIGKGPVVRIRCVIPTPAVKLITPGPLVRKKNERKTSHV